MRRFYILNRHCHFDAAFLLSIPIYFFEEMCNCWTLENEEVRKRQEKELERLAQKQGKQAMGPANPPSDLVF
jgi:hypothetical protein